MSQPDGVEPKDFVQRTDLNTRKVIDVLERKLGEKLGRVVEDKMKAHPTWTSIAGLCIGLLGTIGLLITGMVSPSKDASAAAFKKAEAVEAKLDTKLEKVVSDVQDLKVGAAKQQAVYDVIVRQRSRAEAKADAERTIEKEK